MSMSSLHFAELYRVGQHSCLRDVHHVWHSTPTTCPVPNAVGPDSVSARAAVCASRCAARGCARGWPAGYARGRRPCTVAAVQGLRMTLLQWHAPHAAGPLCAPSPMHAGAWHWFCQLRLLCHLTCLPPGDRAEAAAGHLWRIKVGAGWTLYPRPGTGRPRGVCAGRPSAGDAPCNDVLNHQATHDADDHTHILHEAVAVTRDACDGVQHAKAARTHRLGHPALAHHTMCLIATPPFCSLPAQPRSSSQLPGDGRRSCRTAGACRCRSRARASLLLAGAAGQPHSHRWAHNTPPRLATSKEMQSTRRRLQATGGQLKQLCCS